MLNKQAEQATLEVGRPAQPVAQQRFFQASPDDVNVGPVERWLSIVAGSALVGLGIWRRSSGSSRMAFLGGALLARGVTGYCPLYTAMQYTTSSPRGVQASVDATYAQRLHGSTVVRRMRAAVYRYARNLENWPQFMGGLRAVKGLDRRHSHWEVSGLLGRTLGWDAEIIHEDVCSIIAWRSLPGGDVSHAGAIRFKDATGGGTLVEVTIEYHGLAGKPGVALGHLLGEYPQRRLQRDLERFKRILESSGPVPEEAARLSAAMTP